MTKKLPPQRDLIANPHSRNLSKELTQSLCWISDLDVKIRGCSLCWRPDTRKII